MDPFRSPMYFLAFIQVIILASTALSLPPVNVATLSTSQLRNASHLTHALPLNVSELS